MCDSHSNCPDGYRMTCWRTFLDKAQDFCKLSIPVHFGVVRTAYSSLTWSSKNLSIWCAWYTLVVSYVNAPLVVLYINAHHAVPLSVHDIRLKYHHSSQMLISSTLSQFHCRFALSLSLSTYTCIYIYRDYMFWFHPLQNISITASRRLSGNHSKSTVNSSPNWGWHYWINISHLWMYTKHSRIISYCTIVSSVYFMSIWLNHSIASYISIDFKYSTIADNSKFFMIQYDTSWF